MAGSATESGPERFGCADREVGEGDAAGDGVDLSGLFRAEVSANRRIDFGILGRGADRTGEARG